MSTPAPAPRGALHHVEIWVDDLPAAEASLGWLLERLGHTVQDRWERGVSWRLGPTYLVLESGPDVLPGGHERCRPGVNHLAFHAGPREDMLRLAEEATAHGWRLLFADLHPHAGGPDHAAAYLEDAQGFEVELVGDDED